MFGAGVAGTLFTECHARAPPVSAPPSVAFGKSMDMLHWQTYEPTVQHVCWA
jgi:hypothetical protein